MAEVVNVRIAHSTRRRIVVYLAAAIVCAAAAIWLVGMRLAAPAQRAVPLPADFEATVVTVESQSGATLRGWLTTPGSVRGVVVLLHGVRSSRLDMVSRARFLRKAGYAVVLFDFQAHGESPGRRITFGFLERHDAAAAVAFAKKSFPGKPVGVIGVSLGGAAALLAEPALPAQAMVLESVFPTIEEAVQDRIEMVTGRFTRWMSPLLTLQLRPRVGCGPEDLCPIKHVAALTMPKLFCAGTRDRHTRIEEVREMYRRAASPKELWEVEGAKHEDLHAFQAREYERRILDFLGKYLV